MHTRFLSLTFILLLFATDCFAIQPSMTSSMEGIEEGIEEGIGNNEACSDDELITEQQHFTVKTPGTLGELVKANEKYLYFNNISVSGELNEADFTFMREEMPMLEHIDLSKANIVCVYYNYLPGGYLYLIDGYLPDGAFYGKAIKSIILPNNLKGLGNNSLRETDLTQLDIPASVELYGLNAFYKSKLQFIVLRNPKVIPIAACVFSGTKRSSGILFVPKGTKKDFAADNQWGEFSFIVEIDATEDYVTAVDETFQYVGIYPELIITNVAVKRRPFIKIPETVVFQGKTFNVTGILNYEISNSFCKEIHIPKTITFMSEDTFAGCMELTKIVVDEENPIYFTHEGVLYDRTTSTLITYPEAKDETEYSIPEGVEKIGSWACNNGIIQKVTLPSTLKQIANCGFVNTLKLRSIISKAVNPPLIGSDAFDNTYADAILYVPAESIEAYKKDLEWSRFFDKIYEISDDAGIDAIEVDDNPITVDGNMITVSSKEDIEIFSLDGKQIYKGNSSPIYVPNGLYIIKANGKSIKIKI